MLLAPINLLNKDMYFAPTISQHLNILHQSQRLGVVFLQMMS